MHWYFRNDINFRRLVCLKLTFWNLISNILTTFVFQLEKCKHILANVCLVTIKNLHTSSRRIVIRFKILSHTKVTVFGRFNFFQGICGSNCLSTINNFYSPMITLLQTSKKFWTWKVMYIVTVFKLQSKSWKNMCCSHRWQVLQHLNNDWSYCHGDQ